MSEETKGLIIAQRDTILTDKQLKLFDRIMRVIDRNPNLDHELAIHNRDFCFILNKKTGSKSIEITRDFALKTLHLAQLNYAPVSKQFVEHGNDLHVAADVKVWDDEGEITETGGCSMSEVDKRKSQHPFNDMITVATTRALKRGIEAKTGLPFVNLLILELFGGYQVGKPKTEKVKATMNESSSAEPVGEGEGKGSISVNWKNLPIENRSAGKTIHEMLKLAAADKVVDHEWVNTWWRRVCVNAKELPKLLNFKRKIEADLEALRNGK